MLKRAVLITVLVAFLTLAGCTQLQSDGTGQTEDLSNTDPTLNIDEIRISNTRLRPGDNVRLSVTVHNRNNQPARGTLRLINVAPLTIEERINSDTYRQEDFIDEAVNTALNEIFGIEDTPIEQIDTSKCKIGALRPATDTGFPGESTTCEWILTCQEDAECERISRTYQDPFNVPLTLNLNYSTLLSPSREAVSIEFRPFQDIDSNERQEQTYMIENGDIRFEATYETPISLDTSSIPIEYSLTDTGKDSSNELSSPFRIIYNGSFVDNGIISPLSLDNCDTMVIPESDTSTETECDLQIGQTPVAGDIHNLLISGGYQYQKTEEVQLNIYPTSD